MKIIIVFSILILALTQKPPFWGGNPTYTVKVKMLNDDPITNWNFTYYYDWNLKAERYQHEAPQEDQMCLLPNTNFTKNKLPCAITFAKDGWSYIQFPTKNFCCKCSKSFGAIKYDWLQSNSTYVGIQTVDGVAVTHWTKPGQYLNHYYSTVDKALPVRFYQLKKGNPKSWDFDLKNYNTAPIDPQKFTSKCSTQCAGPCSTLNPANGNLQIQ